jgi:hypothetical protein
VCFTHERLQIILNVIEHKGIVIEYKRVIFEHNCVVLEHTRVLSLSYNLFNLKCDLPDSSESMSSNTGVRTLNVSSDR